MPFRSGWRCSHLWYRFGGWVSFIITSVPGSSGRPSRAKRSSLSGGHHRRSSGCGTAHASRKHPGDCTPSPVRSSCRREASSRSTSESSGEVQVESPPPTAGCSLTGGTPSVSRPASAVDRSPCSGPSGWRPQSSATSDRSRTGFGVVCSPSFGRGRRRQLCPPSGLGHRDVSFRSVLALIKNFHSMEAPAGVPSARCKTSLASIYGFMSETSPAFHLPPFPLLRSLLDDTDLALPKFLEDQTVHGFLPVPSCRHCR